MSWAPVVEIAESFGKQKGRLTVEDNTVQWWRFGYVFRVFTMREAVNAAMFANFANSSDPEELWVVILCNRLVHSYGISSGRSYVSGLSFTPLSMLPCGTHGLIISFEEPNRKHLGLRMLQNPEELLSEVAPSSVSAPLKVGDEMVFCNQNVAVVWNSCSQRVRAYSVRLLHQQNQVNHLAGAPLRAAVIAPIREWPLRSVGTVFSQYMSLNSGDAPSVVLVAIHDIVQKHLYVLCGPDLVRYEGVDLVAPILGVHRFPLVASKAADSSTVELGCLFFPNFTQLAVPLSTHEPIKLLSSEQESNWLAIELSSDVVRIALAASLKLTTSKCFDVILEVLGPADTALWIGDFLASRANENTEEEAFADMFFANAAKLPANTLSRLICYLHILREELSLFLSTASAVEELAYLLWPYVKHWGPDWADHYSSAGAERKLGPDFVDQKLPKILDLCPQVYPAVITCLLSAGGSLLPDFANNPRLFPNIVSIITVIHHVVSGTGHGQLAKFIEDSDMLDHVEDLNPGIRTILLEIMESLGMSSSGSYLRQDKPAGRSICDRPQSGEELALRNAKVLQGLFPHDLRFAEAERLLNIEKPQQCLLGAFVNPKAVSDVGFVEAQREWGTALAARALDAAYGRAALDLNSRVPLLWEQLEAPQIEFSGKCTETDTSIPPIFKTLGEAAEADAWGVFAHGAALGLSVSPHSPGIDSLWVITSAQLNSASGDLYSGFVYGMGLSGHLANLQEWQFYESLVNSDSKGTIAALLGVATSKKGSRDAKLTKVLSVHIRALLPVEAHDAQIVPAEVERAALISLGMLYMEQGARHLTEALSRELVWTPAAEASTDGEIAGQNQAHKLAVGIALGLINLGWGKSSGLDELLHHGTGLHDHSVYSSEIAGGSVCALLLCYAGTNDKALADQISLPQTQVAASYCAPHVFFARALAYHLIMWDHIGASSKWVLSQIPPEFASLDDKAPGMQELWLYFSAAGTITALALKHTASGDAALIDLVIDLIERMFYSKYIKTLSNIVKSVAAPAGGGGPRPHPIDYDSAQVARHLAQLLSSMSVALGALAAGSGNFKVLRLLRKFWQVSPQVLASLGGSVTPLAENLGLDHKCVAQAIGWLFMGGGQRSFKTDPKSVAVLACFSFTRLLGGPNICSTEWEHLRFFWSIVTELRCLYVREDPSKAIQVEIELNDGARQAAKLPLKLPALDSVRAVHVVDPGYMPQTLLADSLAQVLAEGLRIVPKDSERHTLETLLPSARTESELDSTIIQSLRASLEANARKPASRTQREDLKALLSFADRWPSDALQLLKPRDIEQLRLLQWVGQA